MLKGIFPTHGGPANVRLAAGQWDSVVYESSGDGGRAHMAVLDFPKGIAIDGEDTIYIVEFQGGRIRKVTSAGTISTCAGTGQKVEGVERNDARHRAFVLSVLAVLEPLVVLRG